METEITLTELTKNISRKLLDSKYLLEILQEIIDGESHLATLVSIIENNVNTAFNDISVCRKNIHI